MHVLCLSRRHHYLHRIRFALPLSYAIRVPRRRKPMCLHAGFHPGCMGYHPLDPQHLRIHNTLILVVRVRGDITTRFTYLPASRSMCAQRRAMRISAVKTYDRGVLTIGSAISFPASEPTSTLLNNSYHNIVGRYGLLTNGTVIGNSICFRRLCASSTMSKRICSLSFALPFDRVLSMRNTNRKVPCHTSISIMSSARQYDRKRRKRNHILRMTTGLLIRLRLCTSRTIAIVASTCRTRCPAMISATRRDLYTQLNYHFRGIDIPVDLRLPTRPLRKVISI